MSTQAVMMFYDIPEDADIPNPSAEFRAFSFRINLSCWVILEGDLTRAMHTLNNIRRVGGDWHTLAIAESEQDKTLGLATRYMQGEITHHMRRAEASYATAMAELQEAEEIQDSDERETAVRRLRSRARSIQRRMNLLLRDMRSLARTWGISQSQVGLMPAMTKVANIQARMMRRAAEYVRATEELTNHLGSTHPIVTAAKNGAIPAAVLADAAEEEGIATEGLRD